MKFDRVEDAIEDIRTGLQEAVKGRYATKVERIGDVMPQFETWICLQVVDARWKEHHNS